MSRVQRLKAKLLDADDRVLSLDRMRIIKECAARYGSESAGVRFGHTLAELLSRIATPIDEDDLIVGRVPEVLPTDEEECWFEENRDEWFSVPWFWTDGHLTISWETLLTEGVRGICARAERHLDSLAGEDGATLSKRDFLQGTMLCCEAIEGYARRYAEEAERLARSAPSEQRESELLEIAEVCRWVPAHPARTMREAVQSVWLVDLILHAVVGARDFGLGRLDQWLYPFYERDLAAGRLTEAMALELIECLYIKCSEIIGYAAHSNGRKRSLCQDSVQYVVLGGQTPDGQDATNPLSTLCLQAGHLMLKQPTIKVRYLTGIDEGFWLEACRLARAGGPIGFYNDEVEVPAYTSVGVAIEDARDYVHYGCCNANVPGKEGSLMQRWHSLPKYLELVLNRGIDPLTGTRRGPDPGPLERMRSLEDLMVALQNQIRHKMEVDRAAHPPLTDDDTARCSFTLESVFLEDCIERGREWRLGGTRYWHKSQHACGIATVADSLAAIGEVVFGSGELSLAELRDILNQDFGGHEPLRQRLLNRCPKFGNGDHRVDAIAVQVADTFCDEVLRCNEVPHDIRFWPEIYTYHLNSHLGAELGATADGRKRGENISENQSPTYGMDRRGATACLESMAKLPTHRTPGGGTNLRLHPSAVQGEEGLEALSNLLKTFFAAGGQHLQLNIVDSEVLREAQRRPEQFRTLTVRVVGYSAYFVALSPEVQEEVLARTEHGM